MSDAIRGTRPDVRITRRRKAIERSRKKRFFVTFACFGLVVILAWAAFWSPLLTVRSVRVLGSKHVSGAEIESAAHIGSSTNLLLLRTSQIVDDVEKLPWVKHARVERSLPGTLRVRIVEREPALVLTQGTDRWLIDRHGYVIALASGAHRGLPMLAAVPVGSVHAGMRLSTATGAGALRAWRRLPLRIRRQVAAVLAPTAAAITFSLRDGTTVRYGPASDVKDKNRVLLALMRRLAQEGSAAAYIDVRVPTNPALGPAPAGATTAAPATTTSP